MRSGDIDNRIGRMDVMDAMQQGSRLHRKIQKSMGGIYSAEVPLSTTLVMERAEGDIELTVEGRADGIYPGERCIMIDEIKCVARDLAAIEAPVTEHRAQAMCYAYMYYAKKCVPVIREDAEQQEITALSDDAETAGGLLTDGFMQTEGMQTSFLPADIGIRLTYCNVETEEKKYFEEYFEFAELEKWFKKLTDEYFKWAAWQYDWTVERNESIKKTEFPFEYRPGQKDLVTGVYRTILRKKRLFIEAPTGVGKTISTVFPAVKAMGEGLAEKIFYATAKTIARTVAEDTFKLLSEADLKFKLVTITAKEKVCILEKPDCNPVSCPRAKGHYDRVNDAVFDMLTHESGISRELILQYAEKHNVCPFEMCLDISTWADGIVCDYNYIFDPNVYLKRFFADEKPPAYILLADEAHNLVPRACEMYSAELNKSHVLEVKRIINNNDHALAKALETLNKKLLELKRECDGCEVLDSIDELCNPILHLQTLLDEHLRKFHEAEDRDAILDFYFEIRHFAAMYDLMDENYIIVTDFNDDGEFRLRLMCMDPSENLKTCLDKIRASVFFSATLLPINYYREQLGGREDDYAIYAPSPFLPENRLLMIGRGVSTKYSRRSEDEYLKIAEYIEAFVSAKPGNYMVFFPSYKMLSEIAELCGDRIPGLILQKTGMRENEKEEFLAAFEDNSEPHTGFCIMGGIFGEGIDLKNDCLIGAVVVGTGLPQVCNERELFRAFFDERNNTGFEYAYLYAGMNKVEQAAGRVIRTMEDRGAILLLDDRFLQSQYQQLFPREWFPNMVVDKEKMVEELKKFWK